MNLKKILASVAAGALAVSAMGVAAFAEEPDVEDVTTGAESDVEELDTYEGTITMSDTIWWTEKEVSVKDLIGNLDPESVTSIVFTAEDHDFAIGYNTPETWGQPTLKVGEEVEITDMLLVSIPNPDPDSDEETRDPYAKICLSAGDGVDYTLNWVAYGVALPEEEKTPKLTLGLTKATDGGYLCTIMSENTDGNIRFAADDVITLTITADEAVDTSAWIVRLQGFDFGWNGWQGAQGEPGELTLTATVQEILDANEFTIDDLQGINVAIEEMGEDVEVVLALTVVGEYVPDPENPEESTTEEEKPEETTDEGSDTTTAPEGEVTTTGDSQNGPTDGEDGNDKNKPTGVVLALVPAAVAAAGVIISKKRK